MNVSRFIRSITLVLIAGGLVGCSQDEASVKLTPRPVAGDTVRPVLLPGKVSRAKGPVLLSTKLQVSADDTDSGSVRMLQMSEIPYECQPTVTLTFYEGDSVLETMPDIVLVRNC